MIPRYQKVLFCCFATSILLMAFFLFYERQKMRERWMSEADLKPLAAPMAADEADVTFDLADDRDGTITAVTREIALPKEASAKVRALIDRLVVEYSLPRSDHALPAGVAVDDVFLLRASPDDPASPENPVGEEAVINLRGSYIDQHPSGVRTEMLTVLSMLGTLHANVPEIVRVRFLVDGRSRETMAGHVDLVQTYAAVDSTIGPAELQPAP